ncbi:MAG: hypothetical protein H6747_10770 [Deltaproteobacteria bacterium]|nr:hypothetical protein [Deltaproteobacteria bacterium]
MHRRRPLALPRVGSLLLVIVMACSRESEPKAAPDAVTDADAVAVDDGSLGDCGIGCDVLAPGGDVVGDAGGDATGPDADADADAVAVDDGSLGDCGNGCDVLAPGGDVVGDAAPICTTPADCDDANPCTIDLCDPTTGCTNPPHSEPCDDGDACTSGDACQSGNCQGGALLPCDDGNPCTTDTCDPATGCQHATASSTPPAPCDDGDPCTLGDACLFGACVPGTPLSCDDGNACTTDACLPGKGCQSAPAASAALPFACDDNDPCTTGDLCQGATCKAGGPTACDDGDACTIDSCAAGKGCQNAVIAGCGVDLPVPFTETFACASPTAAVWSYETGASAAGASGSGWALTPEPGAAAGTCTAALGSPTSGKGPAATLQCDKSGALDRSLTSPFIQHKPGTIAGVLRAELRLLGSWSQDAELRLEHSRDGKTFYPIAAFDPPAAPATTAAPALRVADLGHLRGERFVLRLRYLDPECAGGPAPRLLRFDVVEAPCGSDADCADHDACTTDACEAKLGCVHTPDAACGPAAKVPYLESFACDGPATVAWAGSSDNVDDQGEGVTWAVDASPEEPGALGGKGCALNCNDGFDYACADDDAYVYAEVVSPVIDASTVAKGSPLFARFALSGSWEGDGWDTLTVDASPDGVSWQPLAELEHDDPTQWQLVALDVSAFAGGPLRLRFRFETEDCDVNDGPGPFVDQLEVSPTACTAAACDDGNACTTDACDTSTGSNAKGCSHAAKVGSCDDGDACTSGDACSAGLCVGTALAAGACDDGDVCTADSCDQVAGCVHVPTAGCGSPQGLPYATDFGCGAAKGWSFAAQNTAVGSGVGPGWAIDQSPAIAAPLGGCALNFNDGYDFACTAGQDAVGGSATGPWIALNAAKGAKIVARFRVAGDWEGGAWDRLHLELGQDGVAFVPLATIEPGPSWAWQPVEVDLSAYAGALVQLRFRFETLDCVDNDGAGPFVDDLLVTVAGCQSDADCGGNPCAVGTCGSDKTCAFAPKSGPCDDGSACTADDACAGGSCIGKAIDCDDGDACSTDACAPGQGCTHAWLAGCGAALTLPHSEGFTCGSKSAGAWTASGADGVSVAADEPAWHVAALPPVAGAPDPHGCALALDLFGSYACGPTANEVATTIASLPFDATGVPPGQALRARFAVGGDWEAGAYDVLRLESRKPGGAWTTRWTATDPPVDSQGLPSWTEVEVPLADLCGSSFELRWRFDSGDCFDNDGVGPRVDDLLVGVAGCKAGDGCDDGDACTEDGCDPGSGQCLHTPSLGACDDGDPCTELDACGKTGCVGVPVACYGDDNPCTVTTCVAGQGCVQQALTESPGKPAPCDDGDACTSDDACKLGLCVGKALAAPLGKPAPCDDGNACTVDGCAPSVGCTHVAADAACDDGKACTGPDLCQNGACVGPQRLCAGGAACVESAPCPVSGCPAAGCDDGDACTVDACADGGCVHTPSAGGCDDGDACTTGDSCTAGGCVGKPDACDDGLRCTADTCTPGTGVPGTAVCSHTPLTGPDCQDGDACTFADACKSGVCAGTAFVPGVAAGPCDDGDACTADGCAPLTGCTHLALTASAAAPAPCDDGLLCTEGDACQAGVCVGAPADCDDRDPCTVDGCDKAKGCVHLPVAVATACDDGDACTLGDTCVGASCKAGAAKGCDDGNVCTTDGCTAKTGACTHAKVAEETPCDDGDACTSGDACRKGVCGGSGKSCDDGNACTADACDAKGACSHVAIAAGGACSDGDACTTGDSCNAGTCAGAAKSCDDGNPCTTDGCDAKTGACSKTALAEDAPCDDGKACTSGDACRKGKCVPAKDACGCSNGQPCDDGDACTSGDTCAAGLCAGTAKGCDDGKPCTIDSCDAASGTCQHATLGDGAGCDDGDACTVTDRCKAGVCAGIQDACDDGKPCTADSCVAGKGCVHAPSKDGGLCDDGNACTSGDACQLGACVGTAKVCPASGCQVATCAPKTGACGVVAKADGVGCDDGSACTSGEVCAGGSCSGVAKGCDDGKPCTIDGCDGKTGACTHVAAKDGSACSDGSACTSGDACEKGGCVGVAVSCDDGKPCTLDGCDPATGGCAHQALADGGACDDGDLCSKGEVCSGGVCGGGKAACDDGDPKTADSCDGKTGACVHNKVEGALPLPYDQGFECGDASLASWQLEAVAKGPKFAFDATPASPGKQAGTCSLNFNNGKDYACDGTANVGADAVSPYLDDSGNPGLPLRWTLQVGGTWEGKGYDRLRVYAAKAGGDFAQLLEIDPPAGGAWLRREVDLSAVAGSVFRLRLAFWSNDCTSNGGTGPFVDTMAVYRVECGAEKACGGGKVCDAGRCVAPAKDGPDLVQIKLTLDKSQVEPGGVVAMTYAYRNQGNASTGLDAGHRIALAKDAAGKELVHSFGLYWLYTMAAGASSPAGYPGSVWSKTLTIPAGTPPGTYYVVQILDSDAEVTETDESNNVGAAQLVVGNASPEPANLQPATPSLATTTVQPGATLQLGLGWSNTGKGPAGVFKDAVRLAKNAALTEGVVTLGGWARQGLPAGAKVDASVSVTLPKDLAAGSWWIGHVVDVDGQVAESAETDNVAAVALTVQAPQLPADLQAAGISATPQQLAPGASFTADLVVKNAGAKAAPAFAVAWRLSTDTTIDGNDTLLATTQRGELAPGDAAAGPVTLQLPGTLAAGSYYLGAQIDSGGAVTEASLANNVALLPLQVASAEAKPDFVPLQLEHLEPKPSYLPGEVVRFRFGIQNKGAKAASGAFTELHVSRNPVLTKGDPGLGYYSFGSLQPGATAGPWTGAMKLPSDLAPGTWTFGQIVDEDGNVDESDEGNNTSGFSIVVAGRPDLAVDGLGLERVVVAPGEVVSVRSRVRNVGTAKAAAHAETLRWSTDATLGADDATLGSLDVGELAEGAASPVAVTKVTIPAGAKPGTYWLGRLAALPAAKAGETSPDTQAGNDARAVAVQVVAKVATLEGLVTYDRVPARDGISEGGSRLAYDQVQKRPARRVLVRAIDAADGSTVRGEALTRDDGSYVLHVPAGVGVRVRAYAQIVGALAEPDGIGRDACKGANFDARVVDNTAGRALYAVQAADVVQAPAKGLTLHAPIGFANGSYSVRSGAPFAIVDTAVDVFETVCEGRADVELPALWIHWSVNNIGTSGDKAKGQINTSHATVESIDGVARPVAYILGKADDDTDEFDDHVIAHELGHYVEGAVFRSDSIGGGHSGGDILDARVAFGEGYGTALAGIALADPGYVDTKGQGQQSGWSKDIAEVPSGNDIGWSSEDAVMFLLWSLWEARDSTPNHGKFDRIFEVMSNHQAKGPSLTTAVAFGAVYNALFGGAAESFQQLWQGAFGVAYDALCVGTCKGSGDVADLFDVDNDAGKGWASARNYPTGGAKRDATFWQLYAPLGLGLRPVDGHDVVTHVGYANARNKVGARRLYRFVGDGAVRTVAVVGLAGATCTQDAIDLRVLGPRADGRFGTIAVDNAKEGARAGCPWVRFEASAGVPYVVEVSSAATIEVQGMTISVGP